MQPPHFRETMSTELMEKCERIGGKLVIEAHSDDEDDDEDFSVCLFLSSLKFYPFCICLRVCFLFFDMNSL